MPQQQGLVINRSHPGGSSVSQLPIRPALPDRVLVESIETRGVDHEQCRLAAAFEQQFPAFRANCAAFRSDRQHRPEMDATCGIITQLILAAAIITRIGVPGGIAVTDECTLAPQNIVRQRRIEPYPHVQSALSPHLHHDDGVRRRDEVSRLIGPSVSQVGGSGHGSLQVQLPAVAADLAAVQVADP